MFQENEVVMFILGIAVFVFMVLNRNHFIRIHSWKTLKWGYFILLAGWFFTILEGLILEFYLDVLEHLCYLISALMVVIWCWKSAFKSDVEELP